MTIEYKDSKRIVGLERTGSTITYEPDLSSSSGWTLTAGGGSATIASSEVTLTANSSSDNPTATFDLGATVSDTAWVMTFKVVYSGLENSASGNGVKYGVGLGSSATVTGWNISGSSFIEYDFRAHASTSKVQPHIAGGNSSGRTETLGSLINDPYSATQYVKLYRLTSTTARMEFYLQSDYSDTPVTLNVTMANTPTGLQYLFLRLFYENVSDSNTIVASEFKIYNGITSVVAAAGDVKPTNVQDNSIFLEKDTARRYWFDAPSIDTSGLKAYYKFDEASGNIINQHTTGDGLASADLTTTGVTYGVTGVISTAVSCDGSNDFMVSPSSTKTDFNFIHALNQAWSINIWFKKANANDGGITALIANRVGSDVGIRIKNLDRSGESETRRFSLEIDSGSAGSTNNMYNSNVDSFFPNDTDWHMLTITADNSITTNAMQVYLDGTLNHNVNRVDVGDGGTPEYPMNFAQEGDGTDYGDYTFDETSFWTRKLSSTDVTTLYNSDSGFAITPATWTMEPTYEEDFSNYTTQSGADASWVSLDTAKNRVNITTKKLDFNIVRDGTSDDIDYDFGTTVSDTAWVLRYKMVMNTPVAPSQYINGGSIGLSSNTGTNTMNIIGLGLEISHYTCTDILNGTPSSSLNYLDDQFSHTPTAETLYVEIIRTSSTSYTIELFSDSNYSTSVEKETVTNLSSSIVNLRYFHIRNFNNGANVAGSLSGTVDNIELYNGVTSIN